MTPGAWEHIKELFEAALEREGSERDAFVKEACERNAQAGEELKRLLTEHERAGSFLEERHNLLDLTVTGPLERTKAAEATQVRRIGPYRTLREIGHGGMGTVYLAERADGQYQKRVAIKVVNPHLRTELILRRFRNERQVLAALDHPNIARLLDGGTTDDERPYLVMDYVEGVPLDAWCDSRRLGVRDRLRLFRKVCAAVQYAHDKDVIHRDIKPTNILVTTEGTPQLMDFGIAKVLSREISAETLETTIGSMPMTPEYASPEQVRGERVGPGSDLYALGVVLYQLLTGQLPYASQAHDLNEMAQLICEQEPVKPSAAASLNTVSELRGESAHGLRRLLAGDLDKVVLKALRKEPERRYTSVAQFSDDIERFLNDLPVRARRETLSYRGLKFLTRNRVPAFAAVLAAGLAIATVIGFSKFPGSAERRSSAQNLAKDSIGARSVAVLPLENISHDPEQEPFADGMTDALIGNLAKIRSLRVISRDSVMRYKGNTIPPAQMAQELNTDAVVRGSVLHMASSLRISLQLNMGAMDRIRWSKTYVRELRDVSAVQDEITKDLAREMQTRLTSQEEARLSSAAPVNRAAYDAYLKGRYFVYKHSVEGFQKGLRLFEEAVDLDPGYGLPWVGIGDAYTSLSGLYLPPHEAMPKAKAAAQRALSIDDNLAEAHATLAYVQSQYEWQWEAAEKSYRRAIYLNPSYAWAHMNYSIFLMEQGRTEESIAEASEAKRVDPLTAWMGANLAWMYYFARRPDEAIRQCRTILDLEPNSVVAHNSLGLAYTQKRMFEQAIAEYRASQVLTPGQRDGTEQLAYVYAVSGKIEQARRVLESFPALSRQRYIDPYSIGLIYVGLNEVDKAFEQFEKAYQNRSEALLTLKVDPWLDSIRSDTRLQNLVRRVGLQP